MNNKETTEIKKLIGIVDMRMTQSHISPFSIKLECLYKYEIIEIKGIGGGAVRLMNDPRYEEEWKVVSNHGCVLENYKIT